MGTQQQRFERRLDEIEHRLPALPAASLRVQRRFVSRLISAATGVYENWKGSARTTAEQTTEQAADLADVSTEAVEAAEPALDESKPAPVDEPLGDLTKAQLYSRAAELDISGRSTMTKAELIDALSRV